MATVPEQPFRFLDLPAEIRCMVYEEVFDPSYFFVDFACCCVKVSGPRRCHLDEPKPGILLACKFIRQEAMPFFSASLTPVAFRTDPRASFSLAPAHYLRHSKTAFINDRSKTIPTRAELPALQTLVVHFCWDINFALDEIIGAPNTPTTSIVPDQEIILNLMEWLRFSAIDELLKDDQTKQLLPANVFLECEIKAGCLECDGLAWYDNIMIDMKKEPHALANKVRKRRFEHDQGCRWFRKQDEGSQDAEVEKVELVGRWADGVLFPAEEVWVGYVAEVLAEDEMEEAEGT